MSATEEGPFPSFFYSRAPLPEKVDLISLKDDSRNKFYWMLSIENELHQCNSHRKLPNTTNLLAPYEDNENELLDCGELEDNYEINPTKSGKYITSFYVPSALQSLIIGPRGSKLKELQDNTNTLIKVPKPHEEPTVKITGHSERSVASARTQIALLLLSKRDKMPATHFVSIPLCSDEIKANFVRFKENILQGPPTRGVDDGVFQRVDKLHLTLVTVALLDDKEKEQARALLMKCQQQLRGIFQNSRPQITLRGVEIMNDDPTEVDVLYGKVNLVDGDRFQQAVDEILDCFYRNGLVRRQFDSVKLHVTLMNSLFHKQDSGKRESFDATYILDRYRDYNFGQVTLREIHLSVRFTTNPGGYYQSLTVITL